MQAGNLYRQVMTVEDRDHLIGNHRGPSWWCPKAYPDAPDRSVLQSRPGDRNVAEGHELDVKEVERLAEMSQDERAKATQE